MIDEADKAPLEVVAILKSLVEDGQLILADGRRVFRTGFEEDKGKISLVLLSCYMTPYVYALHRSPAISI